MSDELKEVKCPGLRADWINGWLAAVGATVLEPRLRLHWTEAANPVAVLSSTEVEPVSALVAAWPDKSQLDDLPIAKNWMGQHGQDTGVIGRKVEVEDFRKRAQAIRGHPRSWTLTSTITDLALNNGNVSNAPFNPSVPRGITLHERLQNSHRSVESSQEWIKDSLKGFGQRVVSNGLGFDQTRISSLADDTKKLTDPVIEVLAFYGLALFTVRGNGIDRQSAGRSRNNSNRERQRGWRALEKGQYCFSWPVWSHALDSDGIDALMDLWKPARKRLWSRLGVHAGWRTVKFEPTTKKDVTRGFGSERL